MLPNPDLKPVYDKVVWLYVFRDFSAKGDDLKAERTSLRFGLSSYPQLFLVDPESLETIGETGREVDTFLNAVRNAHVRKARDLKALERVQQADSRAEELEKKDSVELAKKYFADEDIVVRTRALRILAEKEPGLVAAKAKDLLEIENDTFRYEVCKALKKAGDVKAARALDEVAQNPKGSRNPNVLSSEAAAALETCGDMKSIAALAPRITRGDYKNSGTRIAIDSVMGIVKRFPKAKGEAKDVLRQGFPEPCDPKESDNLRNMCEAFAKHLHDCLEDLTGKKVPFPDPYDARGRERLMKAW
ncbi:MAG: HEAT repeat domain-containing protein [Planctomycetes bacterium]|nr:HEAT repeat domain-containing protein [Planctomycetota bacterium]